MLTTWSIFESVFRIFIESMYLFKLQKYSWLSVIYNRYREVSECACMYADLNELYPVHAQLTELSAWFSGSKWKCVFLFPNVPLHTYSVYTWLIKMCIHSDTNLLKSVAGTHCSFPFWVVLHPSLVKTIDVVTILYHK